MTREQLYQDIQEIHLRCGMTIVFVTHNMREAVCLGDRASTSAFELGVSGFSMIDPTAEKLARREALLSLYLDNGRSIYTVVILIAGSQ